MRVILALTVLAVLGVAGRAPAQTRDRSSLVGNFVIALGGVKSLSFPTVIIGLAVDGAQFIALSSIFDPLMQLTGTARRFP
jgi:hypothetical protein